MFAEGKKGLALELAFAVALTEAAETLVKVSEELAFPGRLPPPALAFWVRVMLPVVEAEKGLTIAALAPMP